MKFIGIQEGTRTQFALSHSQAPLLNSLQEDPSLSNLRNNPSTVYDLNVKTCKLHLKLLLLNNSMGQEILPLEFSTEFECANAVLKERVGPAYFDVTTRPDEAVNNAHFANADYYCAFRLYNPNPAANQAQIAITWEKGAKPSSAQKARFYESQRGKVAASSPGKHRSGSDDQFDAIW